MHHDGFNDNVVLAFRSFSIKIDLHVYVYV